MRLTLIKQFVRQRGATGMSLFILTLIQMYSRSFPTLAELLKRILRMPISWRKRVISCCQVMMVSYKIMVSYVGEKLNRHQVQPNDFEQEFQTSMFPDALTAKDLKPERVSVFLSSRSP